MQEKSLKEKTAQGLLWLGIGNLATQMMNMLFGIFIARILLPEDYGMVGLLLVFSYIASALQESGLTSALINKKDCRHDDYNAVFWFSLLISLSIYILLFFASPLIAKFYHIPELKTLGRIAFLSFVFSSIGTVPHAIMLKSIQSNKIAKINFVSFFIAGIGGILMALGGMAYWGLAFQSISVYLFGSLFSWFAIKWRPSLLINIRPIIPLWKFGIKILFTNIFNIITNNILTIFLGRFFSKNAVGYYNQASKWNQMAFSTLTTMTNNAAQPVFVLSDDDEERSRRVLRKMTRFIAFVSFPCMFGLALIAPEFIIITITEKWTESIPLLRVLCIGGSFLPLSSIFYNLILSRGKSNITLACTICLSIAQLATAYLFRKSGILNMTIAYTSVSILWLFVWQLLVHREIHLHLRDTVKDVLPFFLIAATVMVVTHFITLPIGNIYLRVFAKIGCAVVLYGLSMRLSNARIYQEFIAYAKGSFQKVWKRK
ncbi:MAG: lipopolysaccharide biosynthesis protein [Bacteroides sp.]|nr:lipopolysaccharide biosynthesis protein [Bacteroides sp.]MCM1084924.1 lipopolysaccharide biosynthesis protein [Bacteroides sp.]